jgi:hypothetical protein
MLGVRLPLPLQNRNTTMRLWPNLVEACDLRSQSSGFESQWSHNKRFVDAFDFGCKTHLRIGEDIIQRIGG